MKTEREREIDRERQRERVKDISGNDQHSKAKKEKLKVRRIQS